VLIRPWNADQDGPLTLEGVRAIHQPPNRFRISHQSYEAGTSFDGVQQPGFKYILSGNCVFTFGTSRCELHAGHVCEHAAGEFHFEAGRDEAVEFVSVWELPESIWVPQA
jgi:hypothetical protein